MPKMSLQDALNLAMQYHRAGDSQQADAIYVQILAAQPNQPDALHLRGLLFLSSGQPDMALNLIRRAVSESPNEARYHCSLGQALGISGDMPSAVTACRRAIEIQPDYPEALNNLGNALRGLQQIDAAEQAYRQALAIHPEFPDARKNLGLILRQRGQFQEAAEQYRAVLDARKDDPIAWYNLGIVLYDQGKSDEAVFAYEQSLTFRPGFPEALNNLGSAHRQAGRLDKAIECYRTVLTHRPQDIDAINNLATALHDSGDFSAAKEGYRRSIGLNHNLGVAHVNLGMILLREGNFSEGFVEFDWRTRDSRIPKLLEGLSIPRWTGEDLQGRRILIHAEQGLGDSIQFFRFLAPLLDTGADVTVVVQPGVLRLFRQTNESLPLVSSGEKMPRAEVQCPLMSLPIFLKTTLRTIPSRIPYLRADPLQTDQFRARLAGLGGSFKVGLCWAGMPRHENDRRRSMRLSMLASLGNIEGISLLSLQKGESAQQLQANPELPLVDWTAELNDMADTAALVEALDLVITVDTSVAHLAGALGRPVWVMLPYVADWRWLIDREDSPWYPTMKLFRQTEPGDWPNVIQRIESTLRNRQT